MFSFSDPPRSKKLARRHARRFARRRPAFEVDFSRGDGREAVLGRDGLVLDPEVRAPKLASDVVDDLQADVDGVADRPLGLRQEREWDRALAGSRWSPPPRCQPS